LFINVCQRLQCLTAFINENGAGNETLTAVFTLSDVANEKDQCHSTKKAVSENLPYNKALKKTFSLKYFN
jgi:hypothetical protein